MTAHVAIVFTRYMMLAVEKRESEDPRTLGELFAYFMDEVADVTFAYAFNIIMEIFSNMMIEEFELNEEKNIFNDRQVCVCTYTFHAASSSGGMIGT